MSGNIIVCSLYVFSHPCIRVDALSFDTKSSNFAFRTSFLLLLYIVSTGTYNCFWRFLGTLKVIFVVKGYNKRFWSTRVPQDISLILLLRSCQQLVDLTTRAEFGNDYNGAKKKLKKLKKNF